MDSSRLTAWRERVPRLSWSHRSAGFHQRGERSEAADKAALACRRTGRNKGKLQQIRCTAPPDRHRQDAVNCRSVCRGMQAPAIRRSCRRSERIEPLSSPRRAHRYVLPGIHETGRARKRVHVCRQPSPFASKLCPRNAKRPPCGGPCILFPRPAGTGHGHRNYSALSALAGASVLASGRRVSSMMAMGALSPLRGMASFITRV